MDDKTLLQHIGKEIGKIQRSAAGLSQSAFETDIDKQDAVLRRLEIIGEAAGKLSDNAKAAMPEIPWKQVAGMRNRLIHEYFNVDLSIVWTTLKQDLPALETAVGRYLNRRPPQA